jgi:hypothetical protein
MTTCCTTTSPKLQKLDPLKRVNYTFGLVLGVEEFVQSDTYFLAKHRGENRLLHGYGTVCGLNVSAPTGPNVEVQVAPGWAITPRGQEIKVPQLMCVQVNDWLTANLAALQAALLTTAPPSTLNLCVVLCARECKTDTVPIPGEPCMTQSSSMAPSRIADSFDLMLCLDYSASPPLASPPSTPGTPTGLCLTRPAQLEDDAIRALALLLSEFQVSATGPFLNVSQVEQLVLALAQPLASPPISSPPLGSPPSGPPYWIDAPDAATLRRAALRTWTTQVRPFICSAEGAGPCCPPAEKCVLLAELVVSLTGGATEWIATNISVDDSLRPFLVPTRLLQEIVLSETSATASVAYQPVAAGFFSLTGAPFYTPFNNLTATPGAAASGEFLLTFPGYQVTANYIVKGTVQGAPTPDSPATPASTFEFVDLESGGIRIRIQNVSATALQDRGFMAEITQIGGAT